MPRLSGLVAEAVWVPKVTTFFLADTALTDASIDGTVVCPDAAGARDSRRAVTQLTTAAIGR
jgi:hypothetical protein